MTLALFSAFAQPAAAQDQPQQPEQPKENAAPAKPPADPCPKLAVKSGGTQLVREGSPATFVAEIKGGDPNVVPNILWSVTAGMITSGQGGNRIEVDTAGAASAGQVSAQLWIGGYAPECMNTASAAIRIAPRPALFDEFGELAPEKENERIAAAAAVVGQSNDGFVIIAYAGRTSQRGFTLDSLRRITAQFEKNNVPLDRIRVMDGGFREQPAYEFWLVPEGAERPRATPTVNKSEIVYPNTPRTAPARKPLNRNRRPAGQ